MEGGIMEKRDVIIIGAGPAGLSAAIFTQPDGWSTLVLEGDWVGGQGAIAHTVSNYPGYLPGDGAILIDNMRKQVTSPPPQGVGAELRSEKVLNFGAESLVVKTNMNEYQAKTIILATGSNMQKLGIPGEDRFLGKGVSYYAKLDAEKFKDRKVLVVGGGNTTAKSALMARSTAKEVILAHRRESLRAYPAMVKRLQKEGVQVLYNTEVKELKGGDTLEHAMLVNNRTGQESEMAIGWAIVCVGTEPNTELSRQAGIEMVGDFVKTNAHMMTSKSGVFACGEITGCDRHLVSVAAQGAAAGMAASEYLALLMVKRGEIFEGAKNGKYADEYLAMLKSGEARWVITIF
jgi:thioredoxin reductase (NADPH)